jgi:hypothetical protein
MPRVPAAVIGVALSASAILGYWAYAHRFAAGSGRGLFDLDVLDLPISSAGIPMWLTTIVVAAATVVLVTGVLVLNDGRRWRR